MSCFTFFNVLLMFLLSVLITENSASKHFNRNCFSENEIWSNHFCTNVGGILRFYMGWGVAKGQLDWNSEVIGDNYYVALEIWRQSFFFFRSGLPEGNTDMQIEPKLRSHISKLSRGKANKALEGLMLVDCMLDWNLKKYIYFSLPT